MQLYINYPLCSIILSYKLHHSVSAGALLIYNHPLPKSGGGEKEKEVKVRDTHTGWSLTWACRAAAAAAAAG